MKRIMVFLLLIVVMGVMAGCAGILPSVCDDGGGPSILCDAASKSKIFRLEDIGHGLMLVNGAAILEGKYDKNQALNVLKDIRLILDDPVSYISFQAALKDALSDNVGLFSVTPLFMESFSVPHVMYDRDREYLKYWIDARIAGLGVFD